jgi:DNA-binding response OmpR family regulator
LIVEDEGLLRGLIAQFLRGEGFEVVEAADGGEGVELFTDYGPFDLVLLDLNLPVYPGVEVCRRIRLLEPDQPVLICSAAILDGHVAALSALDVDQFLSKPYHPAELLNRIAILLERVPQTSRPSTDHLSPTTPDPSWRVHSTHPRLAPSQSLFKVRTID